MWTLFHYAELGLVEPSPPFVCTLLSTCRYYYDIGQVTRLFGYSATGQLNLPLFITLLFYLLLV
jgi:hypothetical protein